MENIEVIKVQFRNETATNTLTGYVPISSISCIVEFMEGMYEIHLIGGNDIKLKFKLDKIIATMQPKLFNILNK